MCTSRRNHQMSRDDPHLHQNDATSPIPILASLHNLESATTLLPIDVSATARIQVSGRPRAASHTLQLYP